MSDETYLKEVDLKYYRKLLEEGAKEYNKVVLENQHLHAAIKNCRKDCYITVNNWCNIPPQEVTFDE